MSKPDLGRIIAQTMAKPVEGRTIETITDEILDAKRTGGEAILTIGRCLIEAKDRPQIAPRRQQHRQAMRRKP